MSKAEPKYVIKHRECAECEGTGFITQYTEEEEELEKPVTPGEPFDASSIEADPMQAQRRGQ